MDGVPKQQQGCSVRNVNVSLCPFVADTGS